MSSVGFIPDGHTLTGWVNEVPNLHARVQFTYRRMTTSEYADYIHAVQSMTEKQAQQLIAAHLAARIVSWDRKDPKGQAAPLTESTFLNEVRRLTQRLWVIVAGLEGPDGLVGEDSGASQGDFNAALEAARSGRSPLQLREEAERKN